MKRIEDIEEYVRQGKPHVTTRESVDKRTLSDSFAAMDETLAAQSRAGRPNVWRIILSNKTARLAAAAAIIIAAGLLMVESIRPEQAPPPVGTVTRSPAEMLSAMSLSMAYRRGGIEAVDDVSSKAFKALGSKPARVSARELLTGLNGV